MKRFIALFLTLIFAISFEACGNTTRKETSSSEDTANADEEISNMTTIQVIINEKKFEAELQDNEAARQFIKMLPLQLEMEDLHDNEKFYYFPDSFDTSDEELKEIHEGDLLIYDSKCLVLFYESFETNYSYTPLGKISDVTGLKEALGTGITTISFQAADKSSIVQTSINDISFDFESRTVMLNSGYEMPINGLGTYSLHGDECINSVKSALSSGVRLIDTASAYGNEEEIGQAIREAIDEGIVKREDIFVITKIYPGDEMANPEASIQACLDRLNIGYVDMMLLHHPDTNDVKAYKAMEQFVKDGKIRSIGLSNWYVEELTEFLPQVDTVPALIQNEIHPYYQENDVIPFIQEKGIVVQGWYPLGGRGHTGELLSDPVISEIADAHGVSSAQVILRWNLQKGVVVIPGSSNPDHIKENTELYHFTLSEDEMNRMNALDRNEKHDWY